MLNKNYTAKLLDMEDVNITNVENIAGELYIYLEMPPKSTHTRPVARSLTVYTITACPRCTCGSESEAN